MTLSSATPEWGDMRQPIGVTSGRVEELRSQAAPGRVSPVRRAICGQIALGLPLRRVYRRLAAACEAVFLLIVSIIVLYPLPPDHQGQAALAGYMRTWRRSRRLPELATLETVEFLSNVIMFTPLAFLAAAIVRPGLRWLVAPALTGLSAGIEITQHFFLPDRVAAISDVVSNTIGAVLGLLLFLWASRRWYRAVAPLEYLIGRTVPRTGLQVIEQRVHAIYVWPLVDFLHRRRRLVRPDLVLPTTVTVLAVAVALSVLILPGVLGTVLSVLTSLLLMAFCAALLAGFHRAAPVTGGTDGPSEEV